MIGRYDESIETQITNHSHNLNLCENITSLTGFINLVIPGYIHHFYNLDYLYKYRISYENAKKDKSEKSTCP